MFLNVYDFDKTIYDGDSTIDFFLFSLKKDIKLTRFIPKQILGFVLYKIKIISKTEFKTMFFSFIKDIRKKEEYLREFWLVNLKKIKKWYLEKKESDDVIISASPEFLLEPICKELNINNLIASKVCIKTGRFERKNCYGEEKVNRFYEQFPDGKIDSFFTDSYSDLPLAKKANVAFLVKGKKINTFNIFHESIIKKIKKQFFNKQFSKFFLVGLLNVLNCMLLSGLILLVIPLVNIAFILGYIVSLCVSFLLNTFFVFSEKTISFKKFIRFCISYIPNFLIQNIVLFILSFFQHSKFLIYAFSGAISFPLTYLLLFFFTFNKGKQ